MALKRQYQVTAAFSMASMTDVIFLLLIFFMVTSTFVIPMAMEVNLPESSAEAPVKPSARIFITSDGAIYATFDNEEPREVMPDEMLTFLKLSQEQQPGSYVAVYADETVTYGRLIEVLDAGAANGIHMVLATKAAPESVRPAQADASEAKGNVAAAPAPAPGDAPAAVKTNPTSEATR